jgi:hypothetical protein
MTDRPILFNGPMVRAILDGRKTQTRRVVKMPPFDPCDQGLDIHAIVNIEQCPHGVVGDQLWVREAFMVNEDEIAYAATDQALVGCEKWKPSIHMPKHLSRITLEIVGVRVERLQDISEADAMAEGVEAVSIADVPRNAVWSARQDFAQLWDRINGPGSWDANPWVWVIGFRKIQ